MHGQLQRAAELDGATWACSRVLADLSKAHRGGGSIPASHEHTVNMCGTAHCCEHLHAPCTPSIDSLAIACDPENSTAQMMPPQCSRAAAPRCAVQGFRIQMHCSSPAARQRPLAAPLAAPGRRAVAGSYLQMHACASGWAPASSAPSTSALAHAHRGPRARAGINHKPVDDAHLGAQVSRRESPGLGPTADQAGPVYVFRAALARHPLALLSLSTVPCPTAGACPLHTPGHSARVVGPPLPKMVVS